MKNNESPVEIELIEHTEIDERIHRIENQNQCIKILNDARAVLESFRLEKIKDANPGDSISYTITK